MLFFGLLIFLFLIIIRPQDFVPGIKGLPLVFVMMGVLLLCWIFSPIRKELFRTTIDKFMYLFFSAIIISTISVNWITYSVTTTIETLKIALIYFFTVTIVNSEKRFKIASWTIVVLMTMVAGMGIMQYYGYDITGAGMLWEANKGIWAIKGIGNFDNPNDLAYSVVLVVPFALGLLFKSKNIVNKLIAMLFSGLSVYCIFLTHSRGGFLSLVFCLAAWSYLWISNKGMKYVILIMGTIAVLISFSVNTEGYRNDNSSMGRVEAWGTGMTLLENNPMFGVGKGQFIEYHERDSHSSFVRAGSELGIFGLYAWLGVIYSALIFLIRHLGERSSGKWKLYLIAYTAFLIAYTCGSFFSTRTYDIVFIIIVAMVVILQRITKETTSQDKNEKIFINKNVVILTAGVILGWKLFLMQVW